MDFNIRLVLVLCSLFGIQHVVSLDCGRTGYYCQGNSLDVFLGTPNERACIAFCKQTEGCKWYSWQSNTFCDVLSDCVEEYCPSGMSCQKGESTCSSCGFEGSCEGGSVISNVTVGYESRCVDHCHQTDGCEWYTFISSENGDGGECFMFDSCLEVKVTKVTSLSGDRSCPALTCHEHGECHGEYLAQETVDSKEKCYEACREYEDCAWYTFYTDFNVCLFYEDCKSVDTSCDNCVVGQRTCRF